MPGEERPIKKHKRKQKKQNKTNGEERPMKKDANVNCDKSA